MYLNSEFTHTAQSSIWPASGSHYLLNLGSEKIQPGMSKLAYSYTQQQNVTKVILFVLLNQQSSKSRVKKSGE